MEVKPGYKQTEVGVIPEEWDVSRLSSLLEQPRSVRYGIVQPGKLVPSGCLMLRSQDYSKGWTQPDEMHRVSSELENQYRNARIRRGDLIMTVVGAGIGQVVIAPDWLDGAILSRSTARIAVDESRASREFVKASLESPVGKRQILDCQKEGAQPVVSCQDLAKFFLPCPPPPEQRAIAEALSDVDGLLGGLDRLIATKRDLKQAAMQQLLTGQTRLPGFHGEWETKRIDRIAPLQRGFDLPNPELRPGPFPVVYSNGILNHHCDWQVEGPGVVTGRSGTIGNVTFVEGKFWPHNTALWVTSFKGNDPKFIFYLYTRIGFERFATGSGVPTLNRNDVHSFEILMPPTLPEQTAIAEVLTEMDAELAALAQRREKTRALKQAMMQELLTGKTRLV